MSAILKVLLVSADRQFAFIYISLKRELTFFNNNGVDCSDKVWSISMPKYLILLCDFIRWQLQLIWKSVMVFNFRLGPKRMHPVLPRSTANVLFSISHSLHDPVLYRYLWESIIVLSSAYTCSISFTVWVYGNGQQIWTNKVDKTIKIVKMEYIFTRQMLVGFVLLDL